MTERPDGVDPRGADWTLGVLAGGRSRRMGRDKALIPLASSTMLEHVVARCRPPSGAVLLSGPFERLGDFPWGVVPDRGAGGPLAGIQALASEATTELLAVVPCDMPYLEASTLEPLLALVSDGCEVAFFEGRAGEPEPLPCVLRARAAARAAGELLNASSRRILALQERLRIGLASRPEDEKVFGNVNTPEDLEAAAKFFATRSS